MDDREARLPLIQTVHKLSISHLLELHVFSDTRAIEDGKFV